MHWLMLALAIVTTAGGQFFYKKYFLLRRKYYFVFALALFVATPAVVFVALLELEVGKVYFATAVSQVIVVGASAKFLGERVTSGHWAGMVMIVTGTLLYIV